MAIPLLTILGIVPLIGGLITIGLRSRVGQIIAMIFALITLVLGLVVFFYNDPQALTEKHNWIAAIGAYYALGVDGMGKAMVLLTVVLVPVVLLAEWKTTSLDRGSRFAALVLLLEGLALFVFMASDVLLFYLFFEATLIPMYFLIIGWGGAKAAKAALKFLVYSLAGGLVMLFGVIGVYSVSTSNGAAPSFLISDFVGLEPAGALGKFLFVAFFIAFAVKAPMVPVHTWLPDTAEESNPGSTTLLVGILDKIGTFGMIRFCLTMFPEASKWAAPVVLILAIISILYGALMAIASKNLLRLVAYTSVSHFGFMVLGIFAFTTTSINGSIFYMLGHGFSSAMLFLVVGMLIQRRGSAEIDAFGGIQKIAPLLAGVFLIGGLATLGLPGTMNFAGEFTIMIGAFTTHPVLTVCAVLGTVLASVYVLWAYQRVFTGQPIPAVDQAIKTDLSALECFVVAPLIALLLVFGFFPKPFTNMVEPVAKQAMTHLDVSDPVPGTQGGK